MTTQLKVPDYSASDKQTVFHTSSADETLFGGSAGPGKTAALVAEAITSALEHPGHRVYIFRKTIPELKQSIVPEFNKQIGEYRHNIKWNGQDRVYTFPNQSTIQLAYLQHAPDMYRYQSAEIHLLLIDELTHFTFDEYEYLKTRVRSNDPTRRLRIMSATNPGNIGHGWVKSYFIDVAQPMTEYEENGQTRIFIPAGIKDHPNEDFQTSYLKKLNAITDPDLRRALRDGDWDVFSGQVFTEWRRGKHVVEPLQIPEHWTRWFSYDPGFVNPGGLWFAKDPTTERVYIYREYYDKNVPLSRQAATFKSLESGESMNYRVAGPDFWHTAADKVNTGETFEQVFSKERLNFQPANNDRLAGKNAWHEHLAPGPDGFPKLQVFSNCTNLISHIGSIPYDQNRVEDVDKRFSDLHLYDAGRYGLLTLAQTKQPDPYKPKRMLTRKYQK